MLIFITHESAFFLIGIGSTYLNKYFDDLAISNAQKGIRRPQMGAQTADLMLFMDK